MSGNPGVYGKKRFERLDYAESISEEELATTAVDTNQINTGAVTTAKLATGAKTEQIYVQLGAAGKTIFIPKPPIDITLTNIRMFASVGAAAAGTAATLTAALVEASAGFGTTTTLCGDVIITSTTSHEMAEATSSLTASIGSTQALMIVAQATTLVDDEAGIIISYTKD